MVSMAELSQSSDVPEEEKGDEKILAEAHARFKLAEEAEADNRRDALDDLEFAAGSQWDEKIKADRQADRRPCLTINRLPQHIKQVTNDQRQNRATLRASPVDDKADPDTAKIYSGLMRHIEYDSNADVAYSTGFDCAARSGLGYWRIVTEYVSPTSFDQEIKIKRIRNRFSVFRDPFSQELDGADFNFAFVTDDISKEEYLREYPGSKLAKLGEWESIGNHAPGWIGDRGARIAEYFYKDFKEETLVLLSNGEAGLKSGLVDPLPDGVTVVQERKTQTPVIRWCKINATEILEKTDWPGSYIPIVPVYGEEIDIDGKLDLKGIVRDAKDAQRMYNFWKSAETEAISLAPKTPWLIEEGQIEGYEGDWEAANRRNHAYLKYKAKSVNGSPIPPPMRQSFEPAVQAITQAAMFAADDLKATTGIYDAALGARSNETSGIAIQKRNSQAQTSNYHFIDNLRVSKRHTGRILIDLIPKVYDTARAARIIGEEGEHEVIRINQEFEHKGQLRNYDLSKGKYDVTVDEGPNFQTKRQEAASSMMEFSRAVPQVAAVTADLIAKAQDWPGSQEFAERIKKTLPPGLADDPNKKNDIPPEAQAQMQQMSQMVEQLTGKLHEAHDTIDQKRLELESKERIEMAKIQADIEMTMAKLGSQESLELLRQEIAQIEQRLGLLKFNEPIQNESQEIAPPSGGAPGADMDGGAPNPTGGVPPGTLMEGNDDHGNPSNLSY